MAGATAPAVNLKTAEEIVWISQQSGPRAGILATVENLITCVSTDVDQTLAMPVPVLYVYCGDHVGMYLLGQVRLLDFWAGMAIVFLLYVKSSSLCYILAVKKREGELMTPQQARGARYFQRRLCTVRLLPVA